MSGNGDMILGGGGAVGALGVFLTLGLKGIAAWRDRARWIAEVEAAQIRAQQAEEARAALLDAIPGRIEEGVAAALARLPKPRSPSSAAMPSTEALRRLIGDEVEAYSKRYEAAQDAQIEGLNRRLDDVHRLLTEALRRGGGA